MMIRYWDPRDVGFWGGVRVYQGFQADGLGFRMTGL